MSSPVVLTLYSLPSHSIKVILLHVSFMIAAFPGFKWLFKPPVFACYHNGSFCPHSTKNNIHMAQWTDT